MSSGLAWLAGATVNGLIREFPFVEFDERRMQAMFDRLARWAAQGGMIIGRFGILGAEAGYIWVHNGRTAAELFSCGSAWTVRLHHLARGGGRALAATANAEGPDETVAGVFRRAASAWVGAGSLLDGLPWLVLDHASHFIQGRYRDWRWALAHAEAGTSASAGLPAMLVRDARTAVRQAVELMDQRVKPYVGTGHTGLCARVDAGLKQMLKSGL